MTPAAQKLPNESSKPVVSRDLLHTAQAEKPALALIAAVQPIIEQHTALNNVVPEPIRARPGVAAASARVRVAPVASSSEISKQPKPQTPVVRSIVPTMGPRIIRPSYDTIPRVDMPQSTVRSLEPVIDAISIDKLTETASRGHQTKPAEAVSREHYPIRVGVPHNSLDNLPRAGGETAPLPPLLLTEIDANVPSEPRAVSCNPFETNLGIDIPLQSLDYRDTEPVLPNSSDVMGDNGELDDPFEPYASAVEQTLLTDLESYFPALAEFQSPVYDSERLKLIDHQLEAIASDVAAPLERASVPEHVDMISSETARLIDLLDIPLEMHDQPAFVARASQLEQILIPSLEDTTITAEQSQAVEILLQEMLSDLSIAFDQTDMHRVVEILLQTIMLERLAHADPLLSIDTLNAIGTREYQQDPQTAAWSHIQRLMQSAWRPNNLLGHIAVTLSFAA